MRFVSRTVLYACSLFQIANILLLSPRCPRLIEYKSFFVAMVWNIKRNEGGKNIGINTGSFPSSSPNSSCVPFFFSNINLYKYDVYKSIKLFATVFCLYVLYLPPG